MLNNGNNTVSVIHLIWMDYGIELFRKFLESYIKYPAGYPHDLVLLFNGVNDIRETEPYLDLILEAGIKFQTHINYHRDQDLQVYFWVAERLNTQYLLYFNSYAELLEQAWLEKYMKHINSKDIGIIGASGSWMSYYRSAMNKIPWGWERNKSFSQNMAKYRTLIKAVGYWKWVFPDFPNPHIRTNAFLISRDLMLQIKSRPVGSKKFKAYLLESGRNSITRQVLKKGLQVMVLDRNGILFKPEEWAKAKVFWISEQENLLVSDNQTRKYAASPASEKRGMSFNAWGVK